MLYHWKYKIFIYLTKIWQLFCLVLCSNGMFMWTGIFKADFKPVCLFYPFCCGCGYRKPFIYWKGRLEGFTIWEKGKPREIISMLVIPPYPALDFIVKLLEFHGPFCKSAAVIFIVLCFLPCGQYIPWISLMKDMYFTPICLQVLLDTQVLWCYTCSFSWLCIVLYPHKLWHVPCCPPQADPKCIQYHLMKHHMWE